MGCSPIDPNVLKAVGYDPEVYTGLGIERFATIVHHIDDIRHIDATDRRWLRQF